MKSEPLIKTVKKFLLTNIRLKLKFHYHFRKAGGVLQ